jgi:hypothetical protein
MPHFHVLSGTEERGLKLCMCHRRQLSSQFDALGPSIPDSCGHLPEPVAVRPFRVSLPDRSRGLSQFQARISGPSVSRYVHDCPPDPHTFAYAPPFASPPTATRLHRCLLVIQALGQIGPIGACGSADLGRHLPQRPGLPEPRVKTGGHARPGRPSAEGARRCAITDVTGVRRGDRRYRGARDRRAQAPR